VKKLESAETTIAFASDTPVMSAQQSPPEPSNAVNFATTHWSVVLAAARGGVSSHASEAMAELCRIYWYPLYAFIRRRGHGVHEAEDLTQEFFARLLEKHFLAAADREKGRFRTFLLMAVKRFLANEHDRARSGTRGGGRWIMPLDSLEPETRYRLGAVDTITPERLFEQQWALTLLEQVLARLQSEMTASGKAELFEKLKCHLAGSRNENYAATGARLGITEGAVKVAVHRLRRRYRDILREEIARTVACPE